MKQLELDAVITAEDGSETKTAKEIILAALAQTGNHVPQNVFDQRKVICESLKEASGTVQIDDASYVQIVVSVNSAPDDIVHGKFYIPMNAYFETVTSV